VENNRKFSVSLQRKSLINFLYIRVWIVVSIRDHNKGVLVVLIFVKCNL